MVAGHSPQTLETVRHATCNFLNRVQARGPAWLLAPGTVKIAYCPYVLGEPPNPQQMDAGRFSWKCRRNNPGTYSCMTFFSVITCLLGLRRLKLLI